MENYQMFVDILNTELKPAMGCTEPIAIAYCAAKLRDTLGAIPDEMAVYVSGNIIKNVKSVKVPNTNGRVGIKVAAAIGVLAGDSTKELEVIASIDNSKIAEIDDYAKNIIVKPVDNEHTLYIEIIGKKNDDSAKVIILDAHTNIYLIEKNGKILYFNDKKVENHHLNIDICVSIQDNNLS